MKKTIALISLIALSVSGQPTGTNTVVNSTSVATNGATVTIVFTRTTTMPLTNYAVLQQKKMEFMAARKVMLQNQIDSLNKQLSN